MCSYCIFLCFLIFSNDSASIILQSVLYEKRFLSYISTSSNTISHLKTVITEVLSRLKRIQKSTVKSLQKKSDKFVDRQKRHEGSTREKVEYVDEIIDHTSNYYTCCRHDLSCYRVCILS